MPAECPIGFVRPAELATNVPYAYAAVAGPGRTVFTAGACPLDAEGNTVAVGDVAGQTRQVMANLISTLHAAGATLTDVAKTTVYVASSHRTDLIASWDVVRDAFGTHDTPSTLLGVTALGYPGQLVEVEAIAVANAAVANAAVADAALADAALPDAAVADAALPDATPANAAVADAALSDAGVADAAGTL